MSNVRQIGPSALLQEMEGGQSAFHVGDVKYHQGQSASIQVLPPPVSSCLVPDPNRRGECRSGST